MKLLHGSNGLLLPLTLESHIKKRFPSLDCRFFLSFSTILVRKRLCTICTRNLAHDTLTATRAVLQGSEESKMLREKRNDNNSRKLIGRGVVQLWVVETAA